jgi:hypothetical protein
MVEIRNVFNNYKIKTKRNKKIFKVFILFFLS